MSIMQLKDKNMKALRYLNLIIFISFSFYGIAQKPLAYSGNNGNYILCGREIPKNFQYQIERKGVEESTWQVIKTITAPQSFPDFEATFVDINKTGVSFDIPPKEQFQFLYAKMKRVAVADSFFGYSTTSLLTTIGCMYFDKSADKGKKYEYKISKLTNGSVQELGTTSAISWPGATLKTKLKAKEIYVINKHVNLYYEIVDLAGMQGCKVYRSYYLRGGTEQIVADVSYLNKDGKKQVKIKDYTALSNIGYTYVIVPVDGFGNEGTVSPELHLFNTVPKTIMPGLVGVNTVSDDIKKAIKIYWPKQEIKDVVSIDLFKSDVYDGQYFKIASLPPNQTVYYDYTVMPVKTYFYTIVINGVFEKSPVSARYAGMLNPVNVSIIPPQNVMAEMPDPKVVRISWTNSEPDTRGYYVYRADGNKDSFHLISDIIMRTDKLESFDDTLSSVLQTGTFYYRVSSVNSSYSISPKSALASIIVQGNYVPIVTGISARLLNDEILVIWDNGHEVSKNVMGYNVFVREEDGNGKEIKKWGLFQTIQNPELNMIKYLKPQAGYTYFFKVQNVGMSGTVGDFSNITAVTMEQPSIPGVSNLMGSFGNDKITLTWENPMGIEIENIKLYRGENGKEPTQLILLKPTDYTYTDKSIKSNQAYHYYLVVEGKDKILSRPSDFIEIWSRQ